jgi:hypothetical protein
MGGARYTRHKNQDACRAQPIVSHASMMGYVRHAFRILASTRKAKHATTQDDM